MVPSAVAATLNKSRRFMTITISSVRVTFGGFAHENRRVSRLMLALAHASGCRPKGARLKSRDDLFRAAARFYQNHRVKYQILTTISSWIKTVNILLKWLLTG